MLLLIPLGVTIAASVFSWYSGRQSEKVQAEIAELEAQRARILAADAVERRRMVMEYMTDFRRLVQVELTSRNEVATSLAQSLQEARAIVERRFGSTESDGFIQALREMELALGKVEGERAYFRFLLGALPSMDNAVDLDKALPSPSTLTLPEDYPCHGGLLDLSRGTPKALHGYRLRYTEEDYIDANGTLGMIVAVDHDSGTATVSKAAGALLAASLNDSNTVIEAIVEARRPGQLELSYHSCQLVLDTTHALSTPKAKVGDTLAVYPGVWTLAHVARLGQRAPLPVRTLPRMTGTRQVWSPIFLAFEPTMTEQLVEAYQYLESADTMHQKWHVKLLDEGLLCFSLGDLTFMTRPDLELGALRLEGVTISPQVVSLTVSFYAALNAFIPGMEDDVPSQRTLFPEFIQVLYAELGSARTMYLQRQNAVRLRKLSIIYEDQLDFLQAQSSCGFIVGACDRNGTVEGTITLTKIPGWLLNAVAKQSSARLRAVGGNAEWTVTSAEWISAELGLLRLSLKRSDWRAPPASPALITRLELAGEGLQQETFRDTLENAILGKFASSAVHQLMMAGGGDIVQHQHAGRSAVESLLYSEQPVVAVWGPPGTGKTTLLVNWLLSLFDRKNETAWPSVLITGPTHVAVTKLVIDLLKKAQWLENEVVRYGRAQHIDGTALAPMWHETLLASITEAPEPGESADYLLIRWHHLLGSREGRENISKWLLGPRRIHVATCVGMARRDLGLSRREFDIVIIDEAGKAFDAEILIPAARARHLVIVGDHYQLPPTVTADVLTEEIGYRLPLTEVEALLKRNCFQNLFDKLPVANKGMLTMQYRMHKDIGELVSALFYDGKLSSHRQESGWTLSTHRLAFIDFTAVPSYRHKKDSHSSSPRNPTEVEALTNLLDRLHKTSQAEGRHVLIICPYKAQREDTERAVKRMRLGFKIEVTTVDAVQGGEADLVFLLMTRSSGRVEFLLDRNRLNVALSRARDAVYILGHQECLSPNGEGPVANLIQMGKKQKTLRVIKLQGTPDFQKIARILFPGTASALKGTA